ncbi:peptidoglycan D,D-transpeptidase FtsI family protein [Velocimicrobium porci]|uniref:Peptidoglycan glycosyltransferase n=1 Tax=Velocimicrobium porci TaxID=2606634 RepID=A0A6L5XW29_9FIRM|nr:penicillin-binding transpeptidase domain-containing protein [Velocimicrobium porci]MSS63036.1 peptidoglycan glycosyltransferase [Velocimicrobium porci]
MTKTKTYNRQNLLIVVLVILALSFILVGRLAYLMIVQSVYYGDLARQIHERERPIKAERGRIYDRNGIEIAGNKPVSTISVIHSQIKEPERVIKVLSEELGISEDEVRKRVEKVSSIERIKSNVDKELSDKIRAYKLDGVMVDEDYKRFYPFESLASKVIGFTGSDNQGIIGLEVKYDNYLQGLDGTILTLTTAKGVEIDDAAENRIEPVAGSNLYLSLDINIQKYAEQIATKLLESKEAKSVKMLVMNPQNGELYAMVNVPEFNLNDPYTLPEGTKNPLTEKERNDQLNTMWRNECISDTYEPGSSFKVVTATAALETKSVRLNDSFFCPGYKKVEDRMIRCHKTTGHGSETFVQGIQNSCNPVFMEVGARVGVDGMYKTFRQLGLFQKTGVDLPGEANSIMHNKKNIGAVELATISFGQSFQITPLQLMTAVSTVINGGNRITPHFGVKIESSDEGNIKELSYDTKENMISKDTSETMKQLLESVVAEGSGHNAFLEGFRIGGKTATSEKLPRSSNKYISSFIGFAPADHPKIIALVLIDEPTGIYYGGTIAAPAVKELFDNVLPYIGIKPDPSIREKTKETFGQNSNLILY